MYIYIYIDVYACSYQMLITVPVYPGHAQKACYHIQSLQNANCLHETQHSYHNLLRRQRPRSIM